MRFSPRFRECLEYYGQLRVKGPLSAEVCLRPGLSRKKGALEDHCGSLASRGEKRSIEYCDERMEAGMESASSRLPLESSRSHTSLGWRAQVTFSIPFKQNPRDFCDEAFL